MKWVILTSQIAFIFAAAIIIATQHQNPTTSLMEPPPLDLRCEVLLDRDGLLRAVPESYPFRNGDRIRLALRPSTDCYVYVFALGTSGSVGVLYPSPRIDRGANLLAANCEKLVPAEGWFMFDATPGTEELVILASRAPLAEIDDSLSLSRIAATAWDRYIAPHLHRLADITKDIQYVPGEPRPAETAPFNRVSCRITDEDTVLLHRIRLTHR